MMVCTQRGVRKVCLLAPTNRAQGLSRLVGIGFFTSADEACELYNYYNQNPVKEITEDEKVAN